MKNKIKNIIIILIFGFLSFFVFGVNSVTTESDSGHYIDAAINLLRNKEYSIVQGQLSNYREPVYSFFLAGVFGVFGENNFLAVKLCQFALFALFLVYAYYILKKHFKSKRNIFLLILLLSTFPAFNYYMGVILSEAVFIPILGFFIFLLMDVNFEKFKNIKKVVLLGILLGILVLIKASSILLIFLIILFFLLNKKYKQAFVILFFSFLIIMPWMFRNYNKLGEFSVTSGRQGGMFFSSGYVIRNTSPGDFFKRTVLRFKKGFQVELTEEETDFVFYHNENEIAHGDLQYIKKDYLKNNPDKTEKYFTKYLLLGIVKHPMSAVSQVGLNLVGTLGPEIPRVLKNNKLVADIGLVKKIFYILYLLFHVIIYYFCFIFLVKIVKNFKKEYLIFYLFYVIPLMILSVYSLVIISSRYNTPFFIIYFLLVGFYLENRDNNKS